MKSTENNFCQRYVVRYFSSFIGRNKKRKLSMEGNYWLNINIQGHIAGLYCLFRYLKVFLLTLISLYKNIFLFFLFLDGKNLLLSRKRHWFCWGYRLSCVVKLLWYLYGLYLPPIVIWYSRSTIMTMKESVC